jgi:hypothetical protein
MGRRVIPALLSGALFFALPGTSLAQAPGTIALSVAESSAQAGSSVSILIQVDAGAGIAVAEFTLSYDPALMTPIDVTTTDLTADFALVNTVKTAGKIAVALVSVTGIVDGGGDLVRVVFQVSETALPGQSGALVLDDVALFDEAGQPFQVTLVDGRLAVVELRSVSISLVDISSTPGSTIAVPVSVDQAGGIAAGEFALSFDPDVLTPVSVESTDLTSDFLVIDAMETPGRLGIALISTSAIPGGGGELVKVIFEVSATARGTSNLLLGNASLFDEAGRSFDVQVADGFLVTITATSVEFHSWATVKSKFR